MVSETVNLETQLVEFKKETRIPNAATFILNGEDHTLGNLIRAQLLEDKNVLFAGYRVPHPLENKVELKVQTTAASTPQKAVSMAIAALQHQMTRIEEDFKAEVSNAHSFGGDY